MQAGEDYEVTSAVKDEICCRNFKYKVLVNFRFVLVSVLLLVVVLCVTSGLYHGITLKQYSSVALGLGIWLPSILLGMICIYVAVACVRGSAKTSSVNQCPTSEVVPEYSQSNARNARINLSVRYQPEVDVVSVDGELEIRPIAEEFPHRRQNPSDYNWSKLSGQRNVRSLSSSDVTKYHHKNPPSRGKHGGTDGNEFPSITNRSRQRTREPLQKGFKRSVSESRSCKYKTNESRLTGGITDIADEIYREGKDYELDEDELGECKYYSKAVQGPSRTKLNLPVGTVRRPDIHREDKYSGFGEQEPGESQYYTRRTAEMPSRIIKSNVPTGSIDSRDEMYREGKDYESEEVEMGECKYFSKTVQGPSRAKLNIPAGTVHRPDIYRENKYSGFGEQELGESKYYTRRTAEMPSRIIKTDVPTGCIDSPDKIYSGCKDYESNEDTLEECESYSKAVQGPSWTKINVPAGTVHRPDICKEDKYYSRFGEQEPRESKRYRRRITEMPQRIIKPDAPVGETNYPETCRKDKYTELDKEELSKYKFSSSRTTGEKSRILQSNFPARCISRPETHCEDEAGTVHRPDIYEEDKYLEFGDREPRESKRYRRRITERPQRIMKSDAPVGKTNFPETCRKDKYTELDKEEFRKCEFSNSRTTGGTSRIQQSNFPTVIMNRPQTNSGTSRDDLNTCRIYENGIEEELYGNLSRRDRDRFKSETEILGPHNRRNINYDRRNYSRENRSVTAKHSFPKPELTRSISGVVYRPHENWPNLYSSENSENKVSIFDDKTPAEVQKILNRISNQRSTDTIYPGRFQPSLRN